MFLFFEGSTLTVEETLSFSAKMRSPAHLTDEIHLNKSVNIVLDWLGLNHVKNTLVGDANLKGISGGQKRRLSIGTEIVAGYSILIANLPTNGYVLCFFLLTFGSVCVGSIAA